MPSEATSSGAAHIPSVPDDNNTSNHDTTLAPPSTKRRRTTTSASSSTSSSIRPPVADPAEASNAPTMGRRTFVTSSPQRGSSREMTPPESDGMVKYTRTGRVCKATKGQRVHQCHECGKTYTRAEHLRRHQQNHKPGAFPCDVPGCGRSFYREDLLTRHKVRHDDPLASPSRQASPDSQFSGAGGPLTGQTPTRRIEGVREGPSNEFGVGESGAPSTSSHPPGPSVSDTRTKERYLQFHDLPHTAIPSIPVETGAWPQMQFGVPQQWEPSPPYSPTGYDSPIQNGLQGAALPYYQPQTTPTRNNSSASFYTGYPPYTTSRSPVSAGSSSIHLPHWSHHAHDGTYQHLNTSSGSDVSNYNNLGICNSNSTGHQVFLGNYTAGVWTPEDRDFMEQDELVLSINTSRSSSLDLSFDDNTISNEDRYFNAYWTWIHPLHSVVHQPSFNAHGTSPLLKAAMLALGAQACDSAQDRRTARAIHERCVKVLQKRSLNEWHSYRACDMQAVYLVEIYSIFKSRRPPFQLSSCFGRIYKHLISDPSTSDPTYLGGLMMHDGSAQGGAYSDDFSGIFALDNACKRRLLVACYTLDAQHALLFGRQRSTLFAGNSLDLPFPEPQSSWDVFPYNSLNTESSFTSIVEELERADMHTRSYDAFQSALLTSAMSDTASYPGGLPQIGNMSPKEVCATFKFMMDKLPRTEIAYHTFVMCRTTPIRALLAVAGESWVMGEKLSAPQDFAEQQRIAKDWLDGNAAPTPGCVESVDDAVWHALKLLELNQSYPKTGLLFQEWSLYLASVVIWARGYTNPTTPPRAPRLSVPQPAEPKTSMPEMEKAVTAVMADKRGSGIDNSKARSVLVWVKARLERVDVPHNCGLTNGALDVLGKLVTRGGEDGWFGV